MKKISYMIITTIFCSQSFFALTKAQNELQPNPIASNIDYTVYTKKSKLQRTNPLEFEPHDAFGGAQAQGKYNHKNKTATITAGDITYSFINIKEYPNPQQPDNKKSKKLVIIGSFTNAINKGMPVTMYLFGQLEKNN